MIQSFVVFFSHQLARKREYVCVQFAFVICLHWDVMANLKLLEMYAGKSLHTLCADVRMPITECVYIERGAINTEQYNVHMCECMCVVYIYIYKLHSKQIYYHLNCIVEQIHSFSVNTSGCANANKLRTNELKSIFSFDDWLL